MTKEDSLPEQNISRDLLSSAHEDYLKAIYALDARGQNVNNSALARHLDVSPASATNMVKKLADLNLVTHTPYQDIALTSSGEQVALEVLRHHRLLELYLHQALNIPWDKVHAEAEKLEHVISELLEDAIAAALGHPSVDPHGDPIPTKDGRVEEIEGVLLHEAQVGERYKLVRVLLQDQDRLSYLGTLGLYPEVLVTVLERAPFEGPLLIDVDGNHHALAHDMAASLQVVSL
ncbi:MAG: metal-dependent transcriptional regulator [Caldilineaceae bacterium]|nr:metal-dependent transcriptional regulator [Caldilineaceae bacterium]